MAKTAKRTPIGILRLSLWFWSRTDLMIKLLGLSDVCSLRNVVLKSSHSDTCGISQLPMKSACKKGANYINSGKCLPQFNYSIQLPFSAMTLSDPFLKFHKPLLPFSMVLFLPLLLFLFLLLFLYLLLLLHFLVLLLGLLVFPFPLLGAQLSLVPPTLLVHIPIILTNSNEWLPVRVFTN